MKKKLNKTGKQERVEEGIRVYKRRDKQLKKNIGNVIQSKKGTRLRQNKYEPLSYSSYSNNNVNIDEVYGAVGNVSKDITVYSLKIHTHTNAHKKTAKSCRA